ncbi:MAG: alcohol dehydrogenase catalytic domain-containing protein [Deltaproteobacteria bacterium]|nr:alcohol dehydrogenase catalytic domain-containing protein [Deltaproteobacteria bacterium]
MRAAVYYNNRDVRVEEVPFPKIKEGEVLVKIEASGICGSDVMEWYRIKKAPLVLGHEIAGIITEVGAGVTKFKAGDRVTVAHHVPCNTCRYCLSGNHSVCDTLRTTSFDPGGFCEYVRVPAINVDRGVFLLPDSMSFEEGTFAEPLGCVVRGFRTARMEAGKNVVVIGSGMSGLLHIKLAKALGAGKIIATDITDFRLDAAVKYGADLALKADTDVPAAVKHALGGRLADIVVICVANDKAIEQGLKSLDKGGTILFFAPKEPGATYPMPLFDLWRDNITIVNSYASPPFDTHIAIDLIANNRVNVADMVSHRLGLGQAQEGFTLVSEAKQSIKVILEPQR